MPRIAVFDPLASPQRVLGITGPSEALQPFLGRTDVVIDPDLSLLAVISPTTFEITSYLVPVQHWKHVGGAIVEWSQAEKDAKAAADAVALDTGTRAGARDQLVGFRSNALLLRALADILRDELNILRGNWNAFKVEVAAAASLADLKTRVAAMPNLPDRTLAQLRTAINTRVDGGTIDT